MDEIKATTLIQKIEELEEAIEVLKDGGFYYAYGQLEIRLFELRAERNKSRRQYGHKKSQ